ncbi:MAG: hypothetical protein E7563_07435, partial [Ruminococcaceae bacterium]|nr:hypothetical protein [Oscillospiraceae bacterium]
MSSFFRLRSILSLILVICLLCSFPVVGVSAAAERQVFDENSEAFALYSGGVPSNVMEYDCGNAVTNDKSKSYLRIIQNTSEDDFLSYCNKLSNNGFSVVMNNKTVAADKGYNRFFSFLSADKLYKVYTYYLPYYKETRIIVDTEYNTVHGFSYNSTTGESVEPLICMYGLSTSENGYANTTTTDYSTGKVNSGALVVIRMPDNSLFLHDGGALDQWDDQACDDFMTFCRNLTGKQHGEKVVVNTWFISHAHTDHYQGLPRFFSRQHNNLDLKNIMYNIDIERTYTTRDIYREVRMVASYFPGVKYYKPHTGESFDIAGVGFDVIYALEDRYLPNEDNQIITDYPEIENGKTVTEYDLGGTYRDFCYESDGKSDFNDTSTVLKVTFTSGSKTVDSILYADMNHVEQILWDIYPDSYLETDIMMVPHHLHDEHAELCAMSKADIFLMCQHKSAIFGPDGDISTKDGPGLYRPALYNNYLAMQSAIETPGSKSYWQGNETAVISPFGVKIDLADVTEDTEAPEGYAVYTQGVRAFEYGGWSVDGSDETVSGIDYSDTVNAVETTNKEYVFTRVDTPAYNERYIIMHDQSKNLMSYSAVNPAKDTTSIVWNQQGNAKDIFYFGVDEDGAISEDKIYIDHSNRDNTLWIFKQKTSNAYGNKGIEKGTELSYIENEASVPTYLGGEKRYHHLYASKGIGPVYNEDGTINSVKNGAYWYSVEGADAEGVQERFLHIYPDYSLMYGISNPSGSVEVESFGNGEFLVYRQDGTNYYVLTCNPDTGKWTTEIYTADEVAANFDSLKVRFYKYTSDSGMKSVTLQGPRVFNVLEGTDENTVLSKIPNELIVSDASNNFIHVPSSGTTAKIGYYWIKFESKFVSTSKRTTDDYQLGVYYHNDDATDTKVGEVTVHIQSDILLPDTIVLNARNGYVNKGSSSDTVIRLALPANSAACTFEGQFNTLNGFETRKISITPDMLTDSQGNAVDLSVGGVHDNLTLTYQGTKICDDFSLNIYAQHKVTFVDYDGSVIKEIEVVEGEEVQAPRNPSRPEDKMYTYTFTGWDKDFTTVTEDMVVTAQYTQTRQIYYIRGTFNNWEAVDVMTEISDGVYSFETSLDAGTYEFKAANNNYSMQWPVNGNDVLVLETAADVTFILDTNADTLEASYVRTGYIVKFYNYDGTLLSTQSVLPGGTVTAPQAPTKPADVNYVYTFTGWDKDFTNVSEDMEITAVFSETPQVYYIRGSFNDWSTSDVMTKTEDGIYTFTKSLSSGTYEYKAANDNYSMEWPLGYNKTLTLEQNSEVTFTLDTINHTITATSNALTSEYTVVFKNWDGSILSEIIVTEGEA